MSNHTPKILSVSSLQEAEQLLRKIDSDPSSFSIMAPKAVFRVIQLDNVMLQDAIIIKQDMLSIGGEVAIPKNAFKLEQKQASIALMGTLAQHQLLVQKLQRHYPRLQRLATEFDHFLKQSH